MANKQPSRTLRVALSMGGGVSLGAFSGAALTEALKLLLLYGKDREGRPYKNLEVDVFSGASAGSMCLLVMLRYLAHSPAQWPTIQNAWNRREELRRQSKKELESTPPPERSSWFVEKVKDVFGRTSTSPREPFRELSDQEVIDKAIVGLYRTLPDAVVEGLEPSSEDKKAKLTQLVALQVLQDKQEEIWSSIRLEDLLKDGGKEGGLLNRAMLEQVTTNHLRTFPFSGRQQNKELNKQILADRVAFASTLTCLTPSVFDARPVFNTAQMLSSVDGLTSYSHRTQRVFDLFFKPIPAEDRATLESFQKAREKIIFGRVAGDKKEFDEPDLKEDMHLPFDQRNTLLKYPICWIRAQPAEETEHFAYDVRSEKLWAKMGCTALASGAFPFAFPPVGMSRHWWEFGINKWAATAGKSPKVFEKEFCYVDGGMLDNEPLRQAFRMASVFDSITLLDSWTAQKAPTFERVVLFVDPNISKDEDISKATSSSLINPKDSPIESLKKVFGSVVSTVVDEASAQEANEHEAFSKDLARRDKFRDYIRPLDARLKEQNTILLGQNTLLPLKSFLEKLQENAEDKNLSQTGVTNTGIHGEVARVLWDMFPDQPELVYSALDNYKKLVDVAFKGSKDVAIDPMEYKKLSSALLLVAVDQLMDKEGVSKKSTLVPIGPFKYIRETESEPFKEVKVNMPAHQYAGFGGIISTTAAKNASATGVYCAKSTLRYLASKDQNPISLTTDFITNYGPDPTQLNEGDQEKLRREFKEGNQLLMNFGSQFSKQIPTLHQWAWKFANWAPVFGYSLVEYKPETGDTAPASPPVATNSSGDTLEERLERSFSTSQERSRL